MRSDIVRSQQTRGVLNVPMPKDLPYWLVLNRLRGFGPRRFEALLAQEKSLSNCFVDTTPTPAFTAWCQQQGVAEMLLDWKGVECDLSWAAQPENHLLIWGQACYPDLLKQIATAPPVLFVKGQPEVLHTRQLAIVGSRYPTVSGKENAYNFAHELAKLGFTITSGLALGIDGASHEGCLAAGGATIAVLGNSLEQVYPAKHQRLAQQIPEKGALISEFPIGTGPRAAHFPQRNRLISGLSQGVLVVECALKSGSLITARYALEQGRDIFAVPGSIHNPMAKGCHQLIREGAKCVENVSHIVEEFPGWSPKRQNTLSLPLDETTVASDCPLLKHIGESCISVDSIINKTGLTADKVSSMLLELELREQITSVPGGYIRVAKGRNV